MRSILLLFFMGLSLLAECQESSSGIQLKLDTCKQLDELSKRQLREFYKYRKGETSDTIVFYNSICNCRYVDRWSDGQLHEEGIYQNCQRNGEWIEYGDDKFVVRITHYKNDQRDGPFIAFWANGNFAIKCRYKKGEYDGLYQRFDFDGNLIEETTFDMGRIVKQNIIKDWQPDGAIEYVSPSNLRMQKKKQGVYLWQGGEMILLRELDVEELKTHIFNEELTKKALQDYNERK